MTMASPPTGVSNAELIRWTFEQLNRHDISGLRQFWTAGTVSIVGQGDDVFARWKLTGTHKGPVQGIEGTGKSIRRSTRGSSGSCRPRTRWPTRR
jgi:hypothetical protein